MISLLFASALLLPPLEEAPISTFPAVLETPIDNRQTEGFTVVRPLTNIVDGRVIYPRGSRLLCHYRGFAEGAGARLFIGCADIQVAPPPALRSEEPEDPPLTPTPFTRLPQGTRVMIHLLKTGDTQ
ncbi:MAG: hypothetical protein K9H25_17220 [Rhodospirillum sp.]|nr:hypothetical protein [Rhodospirillum sp.]